MLKGARIDAIGMQYHLFYRAEKLYEETRTLLDPNSIYEHMNLYSNLSNNLQVTEVTVPSYSWEEDDEQLQADVIEFLYSIWFSHPSVTQIIYWNLVDGYAYCPDADPVKIRETQGNMEIGENYYHGGLLRFDMTPKKAYFKLMELIKDKWSTNIEISSDENGLALFRGFFGDYDVRISVDGKEVDVRASFTSGENTLSVVI
jgi:GH35 family endo-1,4-beta-xylanase